MISIKENKLYRLKSDVKIEDLENIGFHSLRAQELISEKVNLKFCGKIEQSYGTNTGLRYHFKACDRIYNPVEKGDHLFFIEMLECAEKENNHPLTSIFK
jgi:hypothetical protein